MSLTSDAAPEVDRLVLSVSRSIDAARIQRHADEAGLANLDLMLHWWDFLLAGRLTRPVATLRSRYRPEADVHDRLDDLVASGFVEESTSGLTATARLRPVLEGLGDELTRRARAAWSHAPDAVATAATAADRLANAATEHHVVAVVHRELPHRDDPSGALHGRLVTLRFIRQHDHVEAWARHGLSAAQMVALTRLWHGEDPGEVTDGTRASLVERGLVDPAVGALTADGRSLRQAIEDDTNRRNAATLAILGDDGPAFLAALRALPSARPSPDPGDT